MTTIKGFFVKRRLKAIINAGFDTINDGCEFAESMYGSVRKTLDNNELKEINSSDGFFSLISGENCCNSGFFPIFLLGQKQLEENCIFGFLNNRIATSS